METAPPPEAAPMSLGARLVNVLVAPSELFEAVAGARFSVANWLVPSVIAALVGLMVSLVTFTQPVLRQQIRDTMDRELDRRMAQQGQRPPPEQIAQIREMMYKVAPISAGVSLVITGLITPFWWGLILWLVGRWVFRSGLPYLRAVEVAALGGLIGALGMLVGVFLALGLGQLFAGPHLGLLVREFNMASRTHLALGAVNVFAIWQMVVMALGLARVVGRPTRPVLLVLAGVWLGYKAIAVLLGLAQMAM